MIRRQPRSRTHDPGLTRKRFVSRSIPLVLFSTIALLATLAVVKSPLTGSSQGRQNKPPDLHWDPPHVDAPLPSVSSTPPCPLSDILKMVAHAPPNSSTISKISTRTNKFAMRRLMLWAC
jgi:hypothetical protein